MASQLDVVVCGPGSIAQAHKENEFVDIERLCLGMLENLTKAISGPCE